MFVERMKIVGLDYKVRRLQLQGSNRKEVRRPENTMMILPLS